MDDCHTTRSDSTDQGIAGISDYRSSRHKEKDGTKPSVRVVCLSLWYFSADIIVHAYFSVPTWKGSRYNTGRKWLRIQRHYWWTISGRIQWRSWGMCKLFCLFLRIYLCLHFLYLMTWNTSHIMFLSENYNEILRVRISVYLTERARQHRNCTCS